MSISTAACDEDPIGKTHAILELPDEMINFGPVREGTEAIRPLRVRNAGPVPLSIDVSLSDGSSENFALGAQLPSSVPATSEVELEVYFRPSDRGSDEGGVTITSDDPEHARAEVRLSGGPIAPELRISPDPVDFAPADTNTVARPIALQ